MTVEIHEQPLLGKPIPGRWYLTMDGRMVKIKNEDPVYLIQGRPSVGACIYHPDGTRAEARYREDRTAFVHRSYRARGANRQLDEEQNLRMELKLAFLVPRYVDYEPTGEYRVPTRKDAAWARMTVAVPAFPSVVTWFTHDELATLQANYDNYPVKDPSGARVILREKASQVAVQERESLIVFRALQYADLKKSGIVPPEILEFVRARMIDGGAEGIRGEAPDASLIDERLLGRLELYTTQKSWGLRVRMRGGMSMEDFGKIFALQEKKTKERENGKADVERADRP